MPESAGVADRCELTAVSMRRGGAKAEMTLEDLVELAADARKNAYAPYSRYRVGAALLTRSGRVYTGCNIENATFGATVCAERVAMWKALSEGEREFDMMAVVTSNGAMPCGLCRQVLAEFAPEMPLVIASLDGSQQQVTVADLLPYHFRPEDVVPELGE